jgi:MOSC domain-containing protein YiiM
MERMQQTEVELAGLFISPGHNYFGRHGGPAGGDAMVMVAGLECRAGRGIVGDRFFDYRKDYKGQITFFSEETYLALCEALGIRGKGPEVFRRNVLTRGVELGAWIGREFEIQGVRFAGTEHCKPCYWMEQAFGPGAEGAMQGRGGLRARILSDGKLRCGGQEVPGKSLQEMGIS